MLTLCVGVEISMTKNVYKIVKNYCFVFIY